MNELLALLVFVLIAFVSFFYFCLFVYLQTPFKQSMVTLADQVITFAERMTSHTKKKHNETKQHRLDM